MSLFGLIITDDQVEDAILATLRKWLPTYLSEVERQVGLTAGYYQRPVESSYTARTDFDNWPEDMIPAIVAITIGLDDEPPKDGGGHYRGQFAVGVSAIAESTDRVSTRRFAYRLGAAVRAALVQHASLDLALGGNVRGVKLVAGRNNELPTEADRTIWASRQVFIVEVGNFVSEAGLPANFDPLPDSTAPWPDPPTINNPNVVLTPQS